MSKKNCLQVHIIHDLEPICPRIFITLEEDCVVLIDIEKLFEFLAILNQVRRQGAQDGGLKF
jgi:hypothetical protein